MSDLISRSALDGFFYSETSGTDEMIEDAVMKYPNMEMEFPDDCRALCKDIIEMCRNVIKTEPSAYNVEKVVGELEEKIDISEHNMKNFDNPAYHLYYAMAKSTNEAFSEAMKIVKAGGVDERT